MLRDCTTLYKSYVEKLPAAMMSKALLSSHAGIWLMAVSGYSGYVFVFLAYVVWAVAALLTKKALSQHPPVLVTGLAAIAGTLVLLPVLIAQRKEVSALPAASWGLILAIGVLWIAVGELLKNYGLEKVDVSRAGLLGLTFPIIVTVLGALFLGDKVTLRFLLGSAVMALGFIIVVF